MIKTITLEHNFAKQPQAIGLFDGTLSFDEFIAKLIALSKTLPIEDKARYGKKEKINENENKVKGDGFELFCELFVAEFGMNGQIGITEYHPLSIQEDDEGVDAYAKNIGSEKSAVQCKFVSEKTHEFSTADSNIGNFLIEARFNGIAWEEASEYKRLFLITSGKGLAFHTIKKWHDRVLVINYQTISQMVVRHPAFWNNCAIYLRGNNEK